MAQILFLVLGEIAHGLIFSFFLQAVGPYSPRLFLWFIMINDRQIGILSSTKHIVLIGYRCSGKTTVGKILAGKTDREFADTDRVIEEKGNTSVEKIVREKGWQGFRAMERQAVAELSRKAPMIIATGGGTIMDAINVENLKKTSWIIWLQAGAALLKERMMQDFALGYKRPSLTGKDPLEEIRAVLSARKFHYEAACDTAIDTEQLTAGEVAADILDKALLPYGGRTHAG